MVASCSQHKSYQTLVLSLRGVQAADATSEAHPPLDPVGAEASLLAGSSP
jgi:hypothetical protein